MIHITSTYILLVKANHMVSPDFSKEGMTNSSTRGKKKTQLVEKIEYLVNTSTIYDRSQCRIYLLNWKISCP